MAVGNKDRKILWGRSGNLCALCRRVLVAEKTEADPEAIVGDEAHIAARSEGGPRWGQLPSGIDLDSNDNLILLCRVHHKAVDDQPNHYTVELLRKVKTDHETWVAQRLDDSKPPGLFDEWSGGLEMKHLRTGGDVWWVMDNAMAYLLTPPSDGDASSDVVDLADEFLQNCQDYGEVSSDIKISGLGRVREAKRELGEQLQRLTDVGLVAFGARQLRIVPGQKPPMQWWVGIITVMPADDPSIVLVPQ